MALKKSQLYGKIWAACDALRGGMDAGQYKDYVLFMLFLRYVSDKYAGPGRFAPPVVIPPGAGFADLAALKGAPDLGDRINRDVIGALIEANHANDRLARSDFPDFNDSNKLGDGREKVERLTRLITIFEDPQLDFARHRADHDDLLGDAYEYLMRHFAAESGKSKGQFYTPAEVSRVVAQVLGVRPGNTLARTTAYDPTCGSGSLLLKVAAQAGRKITLEGQEKDVTTAGLARMNLILHDFPTAHVKSGNTLYDPKFKDGPDLRTYDYVVANPPFSDKTWTTGLTPHADPFQRFAWGVPPAKQGDYAYLLHVVRSMRPATGKAACILPHGVLFRGNAEHVIRRNLVRSGILKGVIGLPPNLFYGTGIPACVVVLDKENAPARRGVFMVDASRGFAKDGPKNRLREQDVHRIVDTFQKGADVPRYARMVGLDELADPRNDYNLNLPRYVDAAEPEDLHDLDAHLRGGIPDRDVVEAFRADWLVLPALQGALFEPADRPGYRRLRLPVADVGPAVVGHPDFGQFAGEVQRAFDGWRVPTAERLRAFDAGAHPKELIHAVAEDLLAAFRRAPLVDAYDVYQHLMDYWAETMGDDAHLIAADGWLAAARPREVVQVQGGDGKKAWPEDHQYTVGKRRYRSDLLPAALVVARHFAAERDALAALDDQIAALEQQLSEAVEEQGGEDGPLAEVAEGEGDKRKVSGKAVKARLKELAHDALFDDERAALKAWQALDGELSDARTERKRAEATLHARVHEKYAALTEAEVKALVIDDKWLAAVASAVRGEVDRVGQHLTGRIRQLAERYETPLPALDARVAALSAKVDGHLARMGATHK